MTDEYKAIEEVAKATGKAVDAGRELGGFLSKYVGGTIQQTMGIVEDMLKQRRWELQVKLMDRSTEFLRQRGLLEPTRNVPLQIAIPLIQAASLEENDSLRDRWATLLVNAADKLSLAEVRRSYISILENLTPLDASLLEIIFSSQIPREDAEIWTVDLPASISENAPADSTRRPPKHVEIALGNLARLGLVEGALAWGGVSPHACVTRTPLGYAFVAAISHDPAPTN